MGATASKSAGIDTERAESLRQTIRSAVERVRLGISAATSAPFRHVDYPLAHSFSYMGDPGLNGPGSLSWRVIGDISSLIGGLRGLMIQAAHPEVVAGVGDHSRYRQDPLGRLSRTSAYVTATTFGAMPEVEEAVETVRRIHRRVQGVSERGVAYDAADPGFSAWVHNALTDSFLVAYQVYGPSKLRPDEADEFVLEQTRVGALLGSDPMPTTASGLSRWISEHPDVAPSGPMRDAMDFLRSPPLKPSIKGPYLVLQAAAAATIPVRLRRILGISSLPGAIAIGRVMVDGLRWAMGSSPSWNVALIRSGATVPEGLFRQPLPIDRTT